MHTLPGSIFKGTLVTPDSKAAKNIIRLACIFCRTFPFLPEESKVQIIVTDSLMEGYHFARISDSEGKMLLYGFYKVPTLPGEKPVYDFYPLDATNNSIRLLWHVLDLTNDNRGIKALADFESWFASIREEEKERLVLSERIPCFLPFSGWEYVESYNGIFNQLQTELHDQLVSRNLEIIQVWNCQISFSPFYKLYEIITWKEGQHYCRSYFLVCWEDDSPEKYVKTIAINGSSSVIHQIREEIINNESGIRLTQQNIIDYVRFFCWAVEGDDGHFVQPNFYEQFPLKGIPAPDQNLKGLKERLTPILMNSDPPFEVKACIAYGPDLFEADFRIEENGMIEMVDDLPLLSELPLQTDRFGSDYLPTLNGLWESTLTRHGEARKKAIEADTDINPYDPLFTLLVKLREKLEKLPDTSPAKFNEILFGDSRSVESCVVSEELYRHHFNHPPASAFTGRELNIRNCIFEKNLSLVGDSPISVPIRFINCLFEQGINVSGSTLEQSLIFENCIFYDRQNKIDPAINFHLLNSESEVIFRNCRIIGQVLATNMRVTGNFSLEGTTVSKVQFEKQVPLENLQVVDLDYINNNSILKRSQIDSWDLLKLDNSRIEGCLNLIFLSENENTNDQLKLLQLASEDPSALPSTIQSSSISLINGAISATGIQVSGNVNFAGTLITGYSYFQNSSFGGDVCFREYGDAFQNTIAFKTYGELWFFNCHIDGLLDLGQSEFNNSIQLYSSVIENYLKIEKSKWAHELDASHIKVKNYISLSGSNCTGKVNLYNASVDGYIDLTYLKCEETVSLDFAQKSPAELDFRYMEVKGGIFAYRRDTTNLDKELLHVGGNIDLSGVAVNILHLEGIRIDGIIKSKAGHFGSLHICYGLGPNVNQMSAGERLSINHSRCAGLILDSIEVRGRLDLSGLKIEDLPARSDSYKRVIESETGKYGCQINFSNIHENLIFFSADNNHLAATRLSDSPLDGHTKDINPMTGSSAVRDIRPGDHSYIRDGLLLNGNRIAGSIDLRNLRVNGPIDLTDSNAGLNIELGSIYQRKDSTEKSKELLSSHCKSLVIQGVQAAGDIDFTGLNTSGSVDATGSIIKKKWSFINKDNKIEMARIGGDLNLTDAEGEELIISGSNFINHSNHTNEPAVRLDRAVFNKLHIIDPEPCFNLSNVVINKWSMGQNESPKAKEYKEVLKKMNPFDKSVYLSVEKILLNQGHKSEADKIRVGMHRHERKILLGNSRHRIKRFGLLGLLSMLLLIIVLTAGSFNYKNVVIVAAIAALIISMVIVRKILLNLFGELHGYGTKLDLLLLYWLAFVLFSTALIHNNADNFERTNKLPNHEIRSNPTDIASYAGNEVTYNSRSISLPDAFHMALVNCTPFVNLSNSGNETYTLRENAWMKFYFWAMAVLSYLLLAGAFIGISNRVRLSN